MGYKLSEIKDFETVCFLDRATHTLNPVTSALIQNDVGITRITAMNSQETFHRFCLLAVICGAPMVRGDGSEWFITQDDVVAHIGLVTGWRPLTAAGFRKALFETLEEKAKQLRIKYRTKVMV
jgi:hypothetical protein